MITIITRTTFPVELWEVMEGLTDKSIPIFRKQKGFISMEVHRAFDNGGTLTIFKWESITDHENCMKSPDWGDLNDEWNHFLERQDVHFEFLFTGTSWK